MPDSNQAAAPGRRARPGRVPPFLVSNLRAKKTILFLLPPYRSQARGGPGKSAWHEVFEHELQDLYDAERQLVVALPKLLDKAAALELKQVFLQHLAETETHVQRIQRAAQLLGIQLGKGTCEGMKGLIEDGETLLGNDDADPAAVDAALIGAAQKVEHYEMAAYDGAICSAENLGHEEVADLLLQTLEEEMAASDTLAEIAGSAALPPPAGKA